MIERPSRRFFLCGLVAAPAIIKVAPLMKIAPLEFLEPLELPHLEVLEALSDMLARMTREAFIPQIYTQIYQAHPLVDLLKERAA
jgi:hypothetical protein